MKRLWAPWRMKFVQASPPEGCVFCEVQKQTDDAHNLVVWRGEKAFVILNRFPYTSGHLMVVANLHHPSFEDLEPACRAEMMELAARGMSVLRKVYRPDGFNMGANVGESAGAGIPGHAHLHVVPRWTGDASFMLTLAETKVMPEALEETYRRVREEWTKH
ncbi:MAG: HIT domain-containing protein [Chloroflexota bacterium]